MVDTSKWDVAVENVKSQIMNDEHADYNKILKEFVEMILADFKPPLKLVNYFIQEQKLDNSVWIEHLSGEGMMVHKGKLDKWIKKFYNRNF